MFLLASCLVSLHRFDGRMSLFITTCRVNYLTGILTPYTLKYKSNHFVAFWCVTKLQILKWPFIVPNCVMIMLLNPFLEMPHLSGG